MKGIYTIKKCSINILFAVLALLLFAVPVHGAEALVPDAVATFTLSNGIVYSTTVSIAEMRGYDEVRDKEVYTGDRYAFVFPYGAKGREITLAFGNIEAMYRDGTEYKNGGSYLLEQGEYTAFCDGTEIQLDVYYSGDIPQVLITSERSRSYLDESKEHTTSGHIIITDGSSTEYNGGLEYIRGRGNTSWKARKKPYNIKLEGKTSLFGMGRSKKYSLIACYDDQSNIRNYIGMEFGKLAGIEYCSSSQYVNLYINGEFRGLYLLTERIEVDENRVNIVDLDLINQQLNPTMDIAESENIWADAGGLGAKWFNIPNDAAADLGGGYLLETELQNRYKNVETCGFISDYGQSVVISSPEYASEGQVAYIQEYYNQFEEALLSDGGVNSLGKHYSEYIDLEAAARMYVFHEFAVNLDAGITSFYMYKDIYGKLTMCSVWDMDKAFGTDYERYGMNISDPEIIWAAENTIYDQEQKTIFTLLCQHADFRREAARRWQEDFVPNLPWLAEQIDLLTEQLEPSVVADSGRWLHTGCTDSEMAVENFKAHTAAVKSFAEKRADFINSFMAEDACYIIYSRNGAKGVMTEKCSYKAGSAATVRENEFYAENATFLGWNTEPDGSGTAYMPGDAVTVDGRDVVLWAQWDNLEPPQTAAQPQAKQGIIAGIIAWFMNIFG